MNIRISKAILWFGFLCAAPIIAQEVPVDPEQDGAVIQTPFGPVPVQIEAPTEVQADAVPAAAAVEQEEADDSDAPISLILDNADIYQVIRIIGDALALNYVIDPAVQGTVNISTSDTLRTSDLLPLLETILKINGATMIQTGNFYQIVPANTAVREPVPLQNDVFQQVAPDDRIVIQVVRMRYVAATEMSQLLTPYLSDAGNIVVYDSGNILLVSERRGNLRKLLDIVDIFDAGAFEGERVRMFAVENAFPSDLIPDLRSIFAGYALSGETTAIRFVPIERLNSILVVTPNASVFPEVEEWLLRLDQPLQSGGVQVFVYRVRNSKAADLQRVLAQLYGRNPVAAPIPAALPGTGPGQIGLPDGTVQPVPSFDSTFFRAEHSNRGRSHYEFSDNPGDSSGICRDRTDAQSVGCSGPTGVDRRANIRSRSGRLALFWPVGNASESRHAGQPTDHCVVYKWRFARCPDLRICRPVEGTFGISKCFRESFPRAYYFSALGSCQRQHGGHF